MVLIMRNLSEERIYCDGSEKWSGWSCHKWVAIGMWFKKPKEGLGLLHGWVRRPPRVGNGGGADRVEGKWWNALWKCEV